MIITKYIYQQRKTYMKKSYFLSLICISFSLFTISIVLSLFTSCSPSTSTAATTTTTGSTTTPPPPAEVQCNKDRDDDGSEVCSEDDGCKGICDEIYDRAGEKGECKKLTSQQGYELDEIYDLLIEVDDLEKLSDEKEDYELDHLKCYLSIGGSGWIKKIEDDLDPREAINTIEWIAENDDVAAILTGDTNDGKEIVEALLLKILPEYSSGNSQASIDETIATISTFENADNDSDKDGLWKIDTSNQKLEIYTATTGLPKQIEFDSIEDVRIFEALSYLKFNNDNIFSFAADESNPNLFDLAFNILNDVCEDTGDEDESTACRKALLCWTDEHSNEDIWDMIEEIDDINGNDERQDALGGKAFNDCTAEEFAELLD